MPSLEGYVRQLMGWREFVRGLYHNFSKQMETENFWNSNRRLKACWWEGTTGLKPVDDTIRKALRYGYVHHIERLMILGNIFNLVTASPHEVYRWFMELFVDSSDWVMQANVYGMALMSDGGIFATKPYICGSNYILKMGDWPKGEWCEILDGLYWSFIERHQEFFYSNARMKMMVGGLHRIDKDKFKRIQSKAMEFIERTTFPA
ncbi:MAG: FAD-binding domain-containing protein [Myxococcaceae bacterium]